MSAALPVCRGNVAKLACRLFYCWVLLRNNNMATNLPVFTLRFAACSGATPGVFPLDLVIFHFIWCSSVFFKAI